MDRSEQTEPVEAHIEDHVEPGPSSGALDGRDVIIISRGIDRELHYDLTKELQEHQRHQACTLFLTTRGGDADAGYRIGRCLRHHYEHVRLVVPSYCKSAGTLIAIAANEIAIGDLGELGPLDVQVRKHNEMAERSSGLDFTQAMEASLGHVMRAFRTALIDIRRGTRISTRLAGEFAAQIAASVASPLYAQIDPNRVGEMQRAISIALEYGTRLNNLSQSLCNSESLTRLVVEYPSHNFVIDRKEASEIFNATGHPSDQEVRFYETIWSKLQEESQFGPKVLPGNDSSGDSNGTSTEEGTTCSSAEQQQPQPKPAGEAAGSPDETNREGSGGQSHGEQPSE